MLAKIRNYFENKREERKMTEQMLRQGAIDNEDYEQRLKKHRKNKIIKMITVAVVLIVAITGAVVYNINRKYTGYTVKKTVQIEDGINSQYEKFGDLIIKYSNDGIAYINYDETVWNQAFEMKTPVVDVCENYAAVGEKNSNKIYIFDKNGLQGEVTTSYPIIKIEVANQGVVAALLEEDDANYIEVLDKKGNILITHKTLIDGNGYPVDFSLSNDGTKMAVSYVCVSSGSIQSKVLFYNFSDVGQNEVDRMVGGFNQYESTIVPVIKFLDNDTVVAVGDDMMSLYSIKQKPSLIKEIKFSKEVRKVFYNEDYIGIVFYDTNGNSPYILTVYNTSGKEQFSYSIDEEYDTYKFAGKNVLLFTDMSCKVISFNKVIKFDYAFSEEIVDIIPEKDKTYLLITNNEIQKINLK
ncbi:MAG: DUF5711 family protein [Eubacterium sp.]